MEKLFVIKIGGNVLDDETCLTSFLQDFAWLPYSKILVHGGGVLATRTARELGIEQKVIDGRRITDSETLKVVTMVYAGFVNKQIVSRLQAYNCNAAGFTGADGNLISAHKRESASIDYGYVGDVDNINTHFLLNLLKNHVTPVIAPITHDGQGQLLNTNADTIAQEISKSLSNFFETSLIYCFEKPGVLKNILDETSLIKNVDQHSFIKLKNEGVVHSGMLPKLENAFVALQQGVKNVTIGKAQDLKQLVHQKAGTTLVHE
ncbi:MAG: acetylglutamate kinase [Ferruginibacter sp.]